jgi:hypothetical protein
MPTEHGELSADEVDEVAKAINERAKDPTDPCPNCGRVPSEVVGRISVATFGVYPGHAVAGLPLVSTVCRQCGFFRQFAAMELGLSFSDALKTLLQADGKAPGA